MYLKAVYSFEDYPEEVSTASEKRSKSLVIAWPRLRRSVRSSAAVVNWISRRPGERRMAGGREASSSTGGFASI